MIAFALRYFFLGAAVGYWLMMAVGAAALVAGL